MQRIALISQNAKVGSMGNSIVFEHPVNERIRRWLRIEFLLAQMHAALPLRSAWDSRHIVTAIAELLEILNRFDAKGDLLMELERRQSHLVPLRTYENVDQTQLISALNQMGHSSNRLQQLSGTMDKKLRENVFMNSIRQRSAIPGGTCSFDLPNYHWWLQQPLKWQEQFLLEWLNLLTPMEEAVDLLLQIIRDSSEAKLETAQSGAYRLSLPGGKMLQLIRIYLPEDHAIFPEISAGRHQIIIRFFHWTGDAQKPQAITDNLPFHLTFCI